MTSRPIEVPVGLFGVQRKTMSGSTRATSAATVSASRVKSSLRSALSQLAPVPVVISGCIEYDGVKPSTVRPGPPKAWTIWLRTSFEPLAAQIISGSSATLSPARSLMVLR